MAKPVKSPDELSFESAFEKLEKIVEEMEGDDLPLEKLLVRFEEGTSLARGLQEKLAKAELKIQQLEKQSEGRLELKAVKIENT
ncbi:MAG: exodeoxyribonuclease VII small subunit [Pedosphaera sp.]|nr:exodeoxyribonuclease VII small subunit [Pedosphaera sp.]